MEKLIDWKAKKRRKPLVLNGARQVGKTWLLLEFGRKHFSNTAYVSLDNNSAARDLFEGDYEIDRIIKGLSLLTGEEIKPEKTLVILDEVQAAPKAITSLKYFCEQAPEYALAAAGSLLGLSAHEGTGFPVGKADSLNLYPLSFIEFLYATGENDLADLVCEGDSSLISVFADRLTDRLKHYYVVGGMPAAVIEFAESNNYNNTREIQLQILGDYTRDFAKHVPARILKRTIDVWKSIPAHLSQENKKFIFGQIRTGARAKDYEESIFWLSQAGLVSRIERVSKPGIPLSAYSDRKSFKLFLLDVGLLSAISNIAPASILEGSRIFTEFKGALTEQYVCQQLISDCGLQPYYWSAENSRGEIDFLVQRESRIYPIEVKAEENLRSKSLRAFSEKYESMDSRRLSLSGYRDEGWMRNIPLFAIGNTEIWKWQHRDLFTASAFGGLCSSPFFGRPRESLQGLAEKEQAEIKKHDISFRGFDYNDSEESVLSGYIEYLFEDDRYTELKEPLARFSDNGIRIIGISTYIAAWIVALPKFGENTLSASTYSLLRSLKR